MLLISLPRIVRAALIEPGMDHIADMPSNTYARLELNSNRYQATGTELEAQ